MNSYPIQILGQGANTEIVAQVDATNSAIRSTLRPLEHNALSILGGHYRLGVRSGTITGTAIVAGAPLFSYRWAGTAPLYTVITKLNATYIPTIAFTAAQEIGLDAIHAISFTTADSGGTSIVPMKMRVNMPPSYVADCRIASTTLLTASTKTLDSSPFISTGSMSNIAGNPTVKLEFEADMAKGEYPLVLGPNEGILIRNTVAFPAAGAVVLVIEMSWVEAATF